MLCIAFILSAQTNQKTFTCILPYTFDNLKIIRIRDVMKKIQILAPIKNQKDIFALKKTDIQKLGLKGVYIYHDYFLEEGFDKIHAFYDEIRELGIEFYINFKNSIDEKQMNDAKKILTFLQIAPVDGVLVNDYAFLSLLKTDHLPFKVIVDSGFNMHNLAGVEFVSYFITPESITLTEEVYLKNISKIKKYTNTKFSINSDNLPWCAEDIKKSNAINLIIIKGDFNNQKKLINGIELIRNIIDNPKNYCDKKLPFRQTKDNSYETNHFMGRFISEDGNEIAFKGNIKKFEWDAKPVKLNKDLEFNNLHLPNINLRLKSLAQINALKTFIQKYNYNPVTSIEYGEILSTNDLAKNSYNDIMEKVQIFCSQYDIKLLLSTPKFLLERDFDRVYEHLLLCKKQLNPYSIVINNIGFWWNIINDEDFDNTKIELGPGLNIKSSPSILCLLRQHTIDAIDLSAFEHIKNLKYGMSQIKDKIPIRKLTVGGNVRIQSSGLCPLNKDPVVVSRLSCTAPCQKSYYAMLDPEINKPFPFAVDGFCRMHMYKNQVLDIFKYVPKLQKIGINEFIIDFHSIPSKFVPILLKRFINAYTSSQNYKTDANFLTCQYGLEG